MKNSIITFILISLFISTSFAQDKSPGFYLKRASNKLKVDDYDGALKDYNAALKLNDADPDIYASRGTLKALYLKDYMGAIKDFDKAIELDIEHIIAYYNRAGLRNDLRDYSGAVDDYTKVLEIMPGFGKVYYKRGKVKFFYLHDKEGACVDWKKAKELNVDNVDEVLQKYCQ